MVEKAPAHGRKVAETSRVHELAARAILIGWEDLSDAECNRCSEEE